MIITCGMCPASFERTFYRRKYCSDACAAAAIRRRDRLRYQNPPRRADCNARAAAWKGAHPETTKAHMHSRHLLRRYNLSVEQYLKMLDDQGGVCYTCHRTENGVHYKQLSVDHDHNCCPGSRSCGKCSRKLLCHQCNSILGMLDEDPVVLQCIADRLDTFFGLPGSVFTSMANYVQEYSVTPTRRN